MLKKSRVALVMTIVGVLGPLGAMQSIAGAQKASAPNPQANVALGERSRSCFSSWRPTAMARSLSKSS